jgi:hypothetical protein
MVLSILKLKLSLMMMIKLLNLLKEITGKSLLNKWKRKNCRKQNQPLLKVLEANWVIGWLKIKAESRKIRPEKRK